MAQRGQNNPTLTLHLEQNRYDSTVLPLPTARPPLPVLAQEMSQPRARYLRLLQKQPPHCFQIVSGDLPTTNYPRFDALRPSAIHLQFTP
jgi:hypothetical protein